MLATPPHTLLDQLRGDPYVGYAYSYPHKTAYRAIEPRTLGEVWEHESRSALSLYIHIPFCEMRCGFCNLFTYSQPADDWVANYLSALGRQMEVVAEQIPAAQFAQLALGGGTPTFLQTAELAQLLEQLKRVLDVPLGNMPISVEASPATTDDEKFALLRHYGVTRLSLGIQSFDADDLGAIGRPQKHDDVTRAIERIRRAGFPILNLDLIYGGEAQTRRGWLESLRAAAQYEPEELYLYPLYVRPLTGLGSRPAKAPSDQRLERYREARDWLLANQYEQVSMRMFRRIGPCEQTTTRYACQSDGMIGLGVGARSYTRQLHYASRFAVRQKSILGIIQNYIEQSPAEMGTVAHGIELHNEEQRRRYLLLSLLQVEGLDARAYHQHFASDLWNDFPQLRELVEHDLATFEGELLALTPAGLELSDAIGPWLYSNEIRERMEGYAWTDA